MKAAGSFELTLQLLQVDTVSPLIKYKLQYVLLQTYSRGRILLQKLITGYPTVFLRSEALQCLVDKQVLSQAASLTQLPSYSELALSAHPISLLPNSLFPRNISTDVPHYILSYLRTQYSS